jgi:hypothetical protein
MRPRPLPFAVFALFFVAIAVTAATSAAQDSSGSGAATPAPSSEAAAPADAAKPDVPVSLDHIRKGLEQSEPSLLKLPDQPTFTLEIQERNRLQEILQTLDVKGGPVPAGGLYAAEIQRIMFPSVSNPLVQPYAAFSQPELLTIILENLIGKAFVGKVISAVTDADRERAQEAARDEVRRTIAQYCTGQPNNGAGIKICDDQAH